ncbi:MAG: S8 family serine peptidase [bacterium]
MRSSVGAPPPAALRRRGAAYRRYRRNSWLLLALLSLLNLAVPAGAASPTKPTLTEPAAGRGKVSSHLLDARRMQRARAGHAAIEAALPGMRMGDDGGVDMELRLWRLTPATQAAIAATGVRTDRADAQTARVIVHGSLEALEGLAALPDVSTIHPLYGAQLRSGAVADQADAAVRADAARVTYDVDGSGVRVGIVSDSFHDILGGDISGNGCARVLTDTAPQRSGDLPERVTVLDSGSGGGTDEGAGMAELVHDLAPGAALLFHAGGSDESAFAAGVDALRACGADVIVDDLIFYAEPMFQDGPIAQAMRRAVDAGVPVFSAAGNEAGFGVAQTLVDHNGDEEEAERPSGADLHDFGGGQQFAAVTLPAGCGVTFVLEWNEPFSGVLGAGAATDLDLWLYSAADAGSTVLSGSLDAQGCSLNVAHGGDPLEIASYVNSSNQSRTVYAAIDHFCGAEGLDFRLITFPMNCNFPGNYGFDTAIFHDAQIYGHAAADGVAAVGAVEARELISNGTAIGSASRIDAEPYSSLGGDLMQTLDDRGQPFSDGPHFRFKPELAAPDGTNTSFFGRDVSSDADSAPNFFGTSAAAPHAAAVAGLLRQAAPGLAPADLVALLQRTARDIAAPGLDPIAGAGSVDAVDALAAVESTPSPTPAAAATPTTPANLGDCDGDGHVTIDDLIRGVTIALDDSGLDTCPSLDRNGDGHVVIDELIAALAVALDGAG